MEGQDRRPVEGACHREPLASLVVALDEGCARGAPGIWGVAGTRVSGGPRLGRVLSRKNAISAGTVYIVV
jgi:hypothetical protein